jgi:transcriptional regulator GlxA family with amidase domain
MRARAPNVPGYRKAIRVGARGQRAGAEDLLAARREGYTIEANLDQDLRLETLVKVSAMSIYHFARRFRDTVGMSPHAYVVVRRIRRAQHMIKHMRSSLNAVATACGFSSQPHFTTAFQCILGVSPDEYRRSVGGISPRA